MGKVIYKGPENSFAIIGGAKLKSGEEIQLPFSAIPEGCVKSKNYEVYDDKGELVTSEPKEIVKDIKLRVGSSRIETVKKKKKVKE